MSTQGYASQITFITKEILAEGRADAGATISGQMLKEGNTDFVKIYKEATQEESDEETDASAQKSKPISQKLKEAVGSVSSNAEGGAFPLMHMLQQT